MNSMKEKAIFKFTVLSSAFLLSGVMINATLIPELQAAYPELSRETIQSFISLPNLTRLAALLLSGMLAAKIGKKRLLLAGSLLFTVGGIFPLFADSYTLIMASRLVLGFGIGLMQPVGVSLIADYYYGEERGTLMGQQGAVVGVGNTILTFIIGVMINFNWKLSFVVYLIGLVVFLLTWKFIPNDAKQSEGTEQEAIRTVKKKAVKLPSSVIVWVIFGVVFNLGLSCIFLSLPLTVVEESIGTAADGANLMFAYSLAALIAGLVFGKFMKTFGRNAGTFAVGLMTVAWLTIGLTSNLILYYVLVSMGGLAYGWFMPYQLMEANKETTEENSTLATSLIFSAGALTNTIAPYFYSFVSRLLSQENSQFTFVIAGCLLLTICVLLAIYTKGTENKNLGVVNNGKDQRTYNH